MTGGSLVTGTDPNTGNIIVENSKMYMFLISKTTPGNKKQTCRKL
jgi:hypothetical protein